jgi:peptidyl-prolyl cis-trans isomerase B (cyclophilin B)
VTQQVELQTSKGNIKIELDEAKAPESVRNFVDHVKRGHYDGTVFHRVIKGFMIQGGGFEPGMKQKATGAPIRNEASNGLKNARYTLAMARTSDPHSRRPSSSSTRPTTPSSTTSPSPRRAGAMRSSAGSSKAPKSSTRSRRYRPAASPATAMCRSRT